MKSLLKQFIVILLLLVTISCATNRNMSESKNVIIPLSGQMGIGEGSIVYSLPQTVLDIVVEAERIIEKPGPYAPYAEDLLGLKDVIKSESESWSIGRVVIKSHEEPDPSEFYVIEASSIFRTNVLSLKREGLILDLNPDIYKTFEERNSKIGPDLSNLRISDLGSDEYFQARNDTVYRLVSVDTAFIKIPYLVEKKKKLTIGELAEKAAVRLMEMRDGKHMILTGEATVFPQNEASINEMNRLEKEYTELFTGKTWRETRKFSYQVIPRKDPAGRKFILCRFSETTGPAAADDNSATPLALELSPEARTKDLTIITRKQGGSSTSKYDKLYYRVPDVVNLKITFGNETFKTSRQLIYQFGSVIRLPANYIIGN